MNKRLKIGIIGTGFGARVHAPMFANHPGFEVAAIASVARGRVEQIQAETGISQVYSNWEEMLAKEELDVVAVTSAPFLHRDMVVRSLQKGCHVLCEKPMAFDEKEALDMLGARDEAGKMGFINFEFRNLPARQKVREIIASGRLGKIIRVRFDWVNGGYISLIGRELGWLGQESSGGGMLGAIGSHMFDSLTWWMNEDLAEVFGQLSTDVKEYRSESGETEIRTADDAFSVIGSFSSGAKLQASFIYATRHPRGTKLEVFGTEGTLVMTDDNKVEVGYGSEPLQLLELTPEHPAPEAASEAVKRYYAAFRPMADKLYEALVSGRPAAELADFEAGLRVQRILDGVRRSAKEGQLVRL